MKSKCSPTIYICVCVCVSLFVSLRYLCGTCKHLLRHFCLCVFLWVKFVWKWYKGTVTPQSEASLCHYNDHYNGSDFTLGLVVANVCIILNHAFTHIVQDQATWYENLSMFVYQCLIYGWSCSFECVGPLFLQGDFLTGLPLVQCQNDTSKVTLYVHASARIYEYACVCVYVCAQAPAPLMTEDTTCLSARRPTKQCACHTIWFISPLEVGLASFNCE